MKEIQASTQIVAMSGVDLNNIPFLEKTDVGVAMGINEYQLTKETGRDGGG